MIERRKSKIAGWGVFATETIPRTSASCRTSEKISNKESLKRERSIRRDIWCFKLTNRTVIDAGVGGNIARFINHSCKPNCYIEIKDGVIWVRAAKTIRRAPSSTTTYNTDGEGLIQYKKCRPGKDAAVSSQTVTVRSTTCTLRVVSPNPTKARRFTTHLGSVANGPHTGSECS